MSINNIHIIIKRKCEILVTIFVKLYKICAFKNRRPADKIYPRGAANSIIFYITFFCPKLYGCSLLAKADLF